MTSNQYSHPVPVSAVDKHLWNSSFSTCQDNQFLPQSQQSLNYVTYAAQPFKGRRHAIPQPAPAQFQHKDTQKLFDIKSEMKQNFLPKPLHEDKEDQFYDKVFKTTYKPMADDRIQTCRAQHGEWYHHKPQNSLKCVKAPSSNNIAFGDPEKVCHRTSEQNHAFPEKTSQRPRPSNAIPPCKNTVMSGDHNLSHFSTTNHSTYRPFPLQKPHKFVTYKPTSIPNGDPEKVVERRTECTSNYLPRDAKMMNGDKGKVFAELFRTSVKHGDSRFGENTSTNHQAFHPHPTKQPNLVKNAYESSFPPGDLQPDRVRSRITGSTQKESYRPNTVGCDSVRRTEDLMLQCDVRDVEHKSTLANHYSTSTHRDFVHKNGKKSKDFPLGPSSIPLDYYKGYVEATQTQADYEEKSRVDRQLIDTALYDKLRVSSIVQPERSLFRRSTTQHSDYAAEGEMWRAPWRKNIHYSTVPMGTLGKFITDYYNGY